MIDVRSSSLLQYFSTVVYSYLATYRIFRLINLMETDSILALFIKIPQPCKIHAQYGSSRQGTFLYRVVSAH